MGTENDPLIPKQHNRTTSGGGYYFLNKSDPSYQGVGSTSAVTDTDAGPVVEGPPMDSNPQEFAPRPLNKNRNAVTNSNSTKVRLHPGLISLQLHHTSDHSRDSSRIIFIFQNNAGVRSNNNNSSSSSSWWKNIFNARGTANTLSAASQRSVMNPNTTQLNKLRKAPIKIEPKVFFSNERTFIAWMHVSIILAGGSIAILAFAEDTNNPFSQLYGIILLPVAISFIIYSMYQYQRRAKMIRTRHPGPYEDTVGPAVLGIMLMLSITAQFALKLYSMHYL